MNPVSLFTTVGQCLNCLTPLGLYFLICEKGMMMSTTHLSYEDCVQRVYKGFSLVLGR